MISHHIRKNDEKIVTVTYLYKDNGESDQQRGREELYMAETGGSMVHSEPRTSPQVFPVLPLGAPCLLSPAACVPLLKVLRDNLVD